MSPSIYKGNNQRVSAGSSVAWEASAKEFDQSEFDVDSKSGYASRKRYDMGTPTARDVSDSPRLHPSGGYFTANVARNEIKVRASKDFNAANEQ